MKQFSIKIDNNRYTYEDSNGLEITRGVSRGAYFMTINNNEYCLSYSEYYGINNLIIEYSYNHNIVPEKECKMVKIILSLVNITNKWSKPSSKWI